MNPFFKRALKAADPDVALQRTVASLIEANSMRYALGLHKEEWAPGKPLKVLLAGYVGSRNTGADVRVEEMVRQFRHVIGDENLEMAICTIDKELSSGYFRTVKQITLPQLFPRFVFDETPKYHGAVACEGSMFKSKFASALTCFMAGTLGMAAAENKLSVGYGAEAGHMTKSLRNFVRKYCADSLVLCRNRPSMDVLGELGVRTTFGTDSAWTFEPAPMEVGHKLLRDAGWDGKKRVVALCPINPFWWPVKPDLAKAVQHKLGGQHKKEHYQSIYFHHKSKENDEKYDTYTQAIAWAADQFQKEEDVFLILVGMEKLDRRSAEKVNRCLDYDIPLFISDTYDMYEMVSVVRNCSIMVSSRFHAIVTSMPGKVASGGITMDERIRNLMADRNHPELFLEVDEDNLPEKILKMLRHLSANQEQIGEDIARVLPRQLELMGQMGIDFMDEVVRVYPEFPRKDLPRTWDAHLPELGTQVAAIMEAHG